MQPSFALEYITPDAVAECWSNVSPELYASLWGKVALYEKFDREDCGPADVIGINSVASFWSEFTETEQAILNGLAEEN